MSVLAQRALAGFPRSAWEPDVSVLVLGTRPHALRGDVALARCALMRHSTRQIPHGQKDTQR
jgi:hypothetical protein